MYQNGGDGFSYDWWKEQKTNHSCILIGFRKDVNTLLWCNAMKYKIMINEAIFKILYELFKFQFHNYKRTQLEQKSHELLKNIQQFLQAHIFFK